jgi:hypothetical protein
MRTEPHTPEPGRRLRALALAASEQHGVFTRGDARDAGLSPRAIDKRVTRGIWIPVDHGVYRAAETPPSWEQRLHAACLASPAVASHRSAAALWSFPGFDRDLIEITALRHRRRKAGDVVWHETVRLDPQHVTTLEGIPATSATRTLLDLGAVVDERALLIALDDAVHRRLTGLDVLRRELDRFGERRRGSGVVRRTVARRLDGRPVPESPLETLFDMLVADHHLPAPTRQWCVRNIRGQVVARVDFAYPAARLAIEIDGARYHGPEGARRRDERRDVALRRMGWRVLRFGLDDLSSRPAEVARRIQEALSRGPASLGVE